MRLDEICVGETDAYQNGSNAGDYKYLSLIFHLAVGKVVLAATE
jgi:hypothetical protein